MAPSPLNPAFIATHFYVRAPGGNQLDCWIGGADESETATASVYVCIPMEEGIHRPRRPNLHRKKIGGSLRTDTARRTQAFGRKERRTRLKP